MASLKYLPWVLILLLAVLGFWLGGQSGSLVGPRQGPEEDQPETVVTLEPASAQCPVIEDGCRLGTGEGTRMEVSFQGDVEPLKPFIATLTSDLELERVTLDFAMSGMEMGVNRFDLTRQPSGLWQGKVVLPVCTTGRRDWIATLDARAGDTAYRARIPFRMQ